MQKKFHGQHLDTILGNEERDAAKAAFDSFDKDCDGYLDERELKKALEEMGQHPTDEDIYKMITEFDSGNKQCLEQQIIKILKKQQHNKNQRVLLLMKLIQLICNNKKVDAFVAMGGNPDKSGYVNSEKLIQIIKDEFKMTIDIERLIQEIDSDNSKKIEYDEFKLLLNQSYFIF